MQPLIDELNILWGSCIQAYDTHTKTNFPMRGALLWTFIDFFRFTMLLKCTKGKLACPECHKYLDFMHLKYGKGILYKSLSMVRGASHAEKE